MLAFSELFIHIVWRLKEDSVLLDKISAALVERYIKESGEALGYELIAVRAMCDHVHALVQILPGVAPGKLAVDLKNSCAEFLDERMKMKKPPTWADEYGAISVSKAHLEQLQTYINTQQARHSEHKTNATLERTIANET